MRNRYSLFLLASQQDSETVLRKQCEKWQKKKKRRSSSTCFCKGAVTHGHTQNNSKYVAWLSLRRSYGWACWGGRDESPWKPQEQPDTTGLETRLDSLDWGPA